ncbi:MAG: hypothetical protein K8S27_00255 [Candidatus Omnitrophica bacterium]|nr:hypothetical protein [Candidatus Omnitrophota bacterium]
MNEAKKRKKFFLVWLGLAGLLIVCVCPVWSGDVFIETFSIPTFKGSYDIRNFTGIALDGSSGKLSLTNDTGWCEIPYRNGQISEQGAFMAPTKGFQLKAVASTPSGVLVYDVLSHSIMGDTGNFRLARPIRNPTGMTHFQGFIYIADGRRNELYVVRLSGQQAEIVQTQSLPGGVVGLASDQRSLYAATNRKIYQYDQNFEIIGQYDLDVSINGITTGPRGELLAVAKGVNKIYIIQGINPQ